MVTAVHMGEPESPAGKVLGGRYRLEYQLGEGGFGTIWRAEQLVLGASVAVKLIDMEIAHQPGALDRFLREAQAAATLRSPHVVQVLDYGVEGDQPFIAMELLEGETLAERLHRLGRLAPSEALQIVTHVARAISRAHECNIIHRDLKPDNVFLVHNEDEEVAKVLDFGVAKIKAPDWLDQSTQTRTGSLIGTPHYMSPEQVQGNKTVDYRSDLWSLGIIAFEMFTGRRPFVGNALGDLVLQICVRDLPVPSRWAPVPVGFDDWFRRAAEREANQRFQSARDLAQALREVIGGGDRDVELVVADEMELLPEGHTAESLSEAVNQKANELVNDTRLQLENAATLRGEPVVASVRNGHQASGSLSIGAALRKSHHDTIPKLWWIVGVAMLALGMLVLLASSKLFRSQRNVATSRTSFMPITVNSGPPSAGAQQTPSVSTERSGNRTETLRAHRSLVKPPMGTAMPADPADKDKRVWGRSQSPIAAIATVHQPTRPTESRVVVSVAPSPSSAAPGNTVSVEPGAVVPPKNRESESSSTAVGAPRADE